MRVTQHFRTDAYTRSDDPQSAVHREGMFSFFFWWMILLCSATQRTPDRAHDNPGVRHVGKAIDEATKVVRGSSFGPESYRVPDTRRGACLRRLQPPPPPRIRCIAVIGEPPQIARPQLPRRAQPLHLSARTTTYFLHGSRTKWTVKFDVTGGFAHGARRPKCR